MLETNRIGLNQTEMDIGGKKREETNRTGQNRTKTGRDRQ